MDEPQNRGVLFLCFNTVLVNLSSHLYKGFNAFLSKLVSESAVIGVLSVQHIVLRKHSSET